MHVPSASIILILFDMLLGLAVPIVLAAFFRKKYGAALVPFFIGMAVMVLFALTLEQIVHSVVLGAPLGGTILNNPYLYGLYGGFMAGLFEEGGRFLAMRFLLKKQHANRSNALMYGAGHGGIEMALLLCFGMINNLVFALAVNAGKLETLLAPLDEAARASLLPGIEQLCTASPFVFLASPLERFAALAAQLALSVIVWKAAAEKGKMGYLALAFVLHLLIDAVSGTLAQLGVPVLAVEAVVYVMAAAVCVIAYRVRKTDDGCEREPA